MNKKNKSLKKGQPILSNQVGKIFCLLFILLLLISCTKNKSVVEKLELEEVSKLVEKDTLYEEVISEAESVREKINKNVVLMSKFKDLTYSDYLDYKKRISDSTLLSEVYKRADSVYLSRFNKIKKEYKNKIDSTIDYYRKFEEKNNPKSYFKVEFVSIDKKYYNYNNDIKNINIKFKIIPLKGPIQGGSFRYSVIPKVTNDEVASGGCRFSHETKRSTIYQWETPYDVEEEFKNINTNTIKNKYSFDYSYMTVRKNNRTLNSTDLFDIPTTYKICLDKDTLDNFDYSYIIKNEYNINIKNRFDIFEKLLNKKKQSINKVAFDFESLINNN